MSKIIKTVTIEEGRTKTTITTKDNYDPLCEVIGIFSLGLFDYKRYTTETKVEKRKN